MAALAVRLREAGAQVRVCAPPDEEFADVLVRVGVPMVPFARPWSSWQRPRTPQEVGERVAQFIDAQYDTLAAEAGRCDILVATGMSHFVARSAAEKAGVPHRFALFCASMLDSPLEHAVFAPPINAHRASIGLPPVDDVRAFMFTDQPWVAQDPTLGPWQESADLDAVWTGAWIVPDERPLPPELEAFLDAGTPPVYVGFGSMRMGEPEGLARTAIEAVRAQGRRALVSRGWAGLGLVDDREDCYAVGEVNQQALFPRVAAIVHHGGAGTTVKAALAGAAQVVLPQAADQPYWAGRVAALGIGATHDGPAPTAESLSAALDSALSPGVRARAAAVAGAIRTDGAAAAAALLLGAARRTRPEVCA
jgi:vancomycin aglycone glucosyltransferase